MNKPMRRRIRYFRDGRQEFIGVGKMRLRELFDLGLIHYAGWRDDVEIERTLPDGNYLYNYCDLKSDEGLMVITSALATRRRKR